MSRSTSSPLAEKTGFILPLGLWILREACRQLKTWQQLPSVRADLWVSVDVSGLQFRHEPLFAEIKQVVTDTGLEPRHLVPGAHRGIAADRPNAVKAVLMQLRSLGIRISVDDFGTGHSSLTRLLNSRRSPEGGSGARPGMEASTEMAAILGSITDMARQLALQVVVEGVENGAQLALLQSFHRQYVQGYVFSKLLDGARATALLERGTSLAPAVAITPAIADGGGAANTAPTVTRGWRPNPRYAAAALLSVVAVTAAVLVLRGSTKTFAPGAVGAGGGGPRRLDHKRAPRTLAPRPSPPPLQHPPARARTPPPHAATAAAKGITTRERNPPRPPAAGGAAAGTSAASPVTTAQVVHQHRMAVAKGAEGVHGRPRVRARRAGRQRRLYLRDGDFVHDLDGETLAPKTSDRPSGSSRQH